MLSQIDYQVTTMWNGFVSAIPVIVIAIIVLLLTGLIAGAGSKIADKVTGKTELRPSLKTLIDTLMKLGIWLLDGYRDIRDLPFPAQLRLRLEGPGALAEYGQVRELDIMVPVPGDWIGGQKVTLQFRLTLTPEGGERRE